MDHQHGLVTGFAIDKGVDLYFDVRGQMEDGRRKMADGRCKNYSVVTSETSVAYVNGVSEAIFKVGMCLPAGPYVTDDDVRYIVETIKKNIL